MIRKAVLGLSMASLVACGGGGGSSSTTSPGDGGDGGTTPPPTGGAADGIVSKGIISGGLVEARKANGDLIDTATTDDEGHYHIDLQGYAGVVKLLLKPQQGALATCDVAQCRSAAEDDEDSDGDGTIEFGERYALDYELRSVIHVDESAEEVSAHVTPLTTLVAAKAGEMPDQASVEIANSFVGNMLGLDANPSEVAPVDLTRASEAGERELRFALLNAAVEETAENGDVGGLLQGISASFASNIVEAEALTSLSDAVNAVAAAAKAGNGGLAGVEDAATASRGKLGDAIAKACGDSSVCSPDFDLTPELESNLEKAKALVATARKVTVEAIDTVDVELNETSTGYNADNVIVQLRNTDALLGDEARDTVSAFGEMAAVLVDQIAAVEFEGAALIADLGEAAAYYYDRGVEDGCWWIDWDQATQDACYAAAEAERSAYIAQFAAGSITHSANGWQIEGALFDTDGDAGTTADRVRVDLNITLPSVSGDTETGFGVAAGESELAINGAAELGETGLTVADSSKLVLELAEDFVDSGESNPQVSHVALLLQAQLENTGHRFSGALEVAARKSERFAQLNPGSDTASLIPEKLSLSGSFEDKAKASSVDASVVLTVDNADAFGYLSDEFERQDLTGYSYDPEDNTLTVVHGESGNQVSVRYSHSVQQLDGYTEHYIDIECLDVVGEASCPAAKQYHYWGRDITLAAASEEDCYSLAGSYGYWDSLTQTCYQYLDADSSGVSEDIRVAFTAHYEYLLRDLEAYVPAEGIYRAGPDNWYPTYYTNSIIPSDSDSGFIPAELAEPDMDFDAEGRYLQFTLRTAASGKLSANLPSMDVELVARRTGYRVGNVTLDLAWGSDSLRLEYPYSGEDSRSVTLSDGEGTTMTLALAAEEGEVVGTISKDGTAYGVITNENGTYLINWIDDAIETLY